MADENGYVGRYGDTLRRLTALDASQGAFRPQPMGGADTGGFGPALQVQPTDSGTSNIRPVQPDPPPAEKKQGGGGGMDIMGMIGGMGGGGGGGGGGMMSGGAGFTSGAGSGGGMMFAARGGLLRPGQTMVGEQGPEMVNMDQSGNANVIPNHQLPPDMGGSAGGFQDPGMSPISQGEQPVGWSDIHDEMPDKVKDQLADQVEKSGGGNLNRMFDKVKAILGEEKTPGGMTRREIAGYIAEVSLRAMSKRRDPQYAQNPDGVFADAVLETQANYDARGEKKRKEDKDTAEVRRKEAREDTKEERVYKRSRTDKQSDHTQDRQEKIEDDERNHKQAMELAKLQAKLMREKGQRTSIQVADDGTLKLVDLQSGEAVGVTEEAEETTTTARPHSAPVTTTKKVRKPVKAAAKTNASGLDQDTVQRMINDRIKTLSEQDRKFKKLPPEQQSKIATALVMKETGAVRGSVTNDNPFDQFDGK